jgi:hypothetical protein
MNELCSDGRGTLVEGCVGLGQFAELGIALLFWLVLVVLPITFLISLAFVRLFRVRVKQSMRATESASPNVERQWTPSGPPGELTIDVLRGVGHRSDAARSIPLLTELRRHARDVALTYGWAACIQPLMLATVLVAVVRSTPRDNVILAAVLYISFFLVNATPVVLAPTIVFTRRVSFLVLAVLALIMVLSAFDRAVSSNWVGNWVGLWLQIAGVATGAVLLLNTRRLRAVGPIVLAAALLFAYCTAAGWVSASELACNAIGPVHLVREDLAQLPLRDGLERYRQELVSLSVPGMLAEVRAIVSEPSRFATFAHPEALTMEVKLEVFGLSLAGAVLGATASFAFIRWLAGHYRTRRASDQMLSVDVLMAIFTLSSLLGLTAAFGWIAGGCAIASFAAYSFAAHRALRRRQRLAPAVEPQTLLLLRVFGFDRRTQQLLDDLGQRWRYLGPIRLIGGVDLVNTTLEPHEFFEFLNGRLTRAFIKNRDDLEKRLRENAPSPDPDGLFRIEDFYCHDDTWRMTVCSVAGKADAVLMDLRGFSQSNQGCTFELRQLIASVSVPRILLLIDHASDLSLLERTLQDAWRSMPSDSPNCVAGDHRLRVLLASRSHRRTLDTVTGLLCESVSLPRV